jgi:DNA replication protein DnaC
MPPDFEEIQLSKKQIDELIYQERLRIYFEVKDIQAKNLSYNEKVEAKRLFSASELSDFILLKNPSFELDEFSKPIFDMLCLYFSRDKNFESCGENFSLYKGICLAGNPGIGKTKIMELFELNKRQCYLVMNMERVQQDCKENFDNYQIYSAAVPGWGGTKRYFYQEQVLWCIDDIGKEELLMSYGNKAFIFSKIIELRSSKKHLLQYYPLHITTMLTAEQIGDKYGDYIRSRMREQFNWINYQGIDRRK